jgi:hypothetical protein
VSTPENLSSEAEVVLAAIERVNEKLDAAKRSQEALREELQEDAQSRFRQTVALVVAVALFLLSGFTGYVQYDRVTRCHSKADTIAVIKKVIKQDHRALPDGLLKGFGEGKDTKHVVAVIRSSYDDSEKQIDILLPVPDCSGFLP